MAQRKARPSVGKKLQRTWRDSEWMCLPFGFFVNDNDSGQSLHSFPSKFFCPASYAQLIPPVLKYVVAFDYPFRL